MVGTAGVIITPSCRREVFIFVGLVEVEFWKMLDGRIIDFCWLRKDFTIL